jgi:dihydropteroate synthase
MTPFTLTWGSHRLVLGARTRVMGIVNVTPDSFSDGGRFLKPEAAIDQGLRLLDEGADILDIGGESTRPFSDPVALDEELRRVLPVIEALARRDGALISIDTTKAEVARRALEAGAVIINDVSALRVDPEMGPLAARYGVPVVLMHMLGTPKTMQVDPHYEDVVADVGDFLRQAVDRAVAAGIDASLLLIDPGFGFGKTFDHNLQLLNGLHRLHALNLPMLVGTSRKAFIRHLLKPPGEADLPADLPLIAAGTQATVAAAALKGAHIIRVHDVAETRATLTIIDAIRNAGGDARQEISGGR